MKKINCFVLCICMCMVLFACGREDVELIQSDSATEAVSEVASVPSESVTEQQSDICIYICGCVKEPGVYNLSWNSRVCDAIEAAGGFTKKADTSYWNQAQQMSDGMMIYVPSVDEKLEEPASSNEEADNGKVNINTATKEELMSISGIGESRAEGIIRYREEHGEFSSIEDIMLVSGIGNSLFERMREYIAVN